MRPAASTPLLLTLLVAGCVTAPAAEEDLLPEDPLAATELTWSMLGCRFGVVILDVPASAVAPFVPDGFRVLSSAEVGAEGQVGQDVPNPRGDGNLGFEVFECDEGAGLNGSVAPMIYASVFTGVEPPEELRRDVENHFVKWDVLIPDAPRRDALAAAGIPARGGNATVTTQVLGGSATSYTATLTFDGLGEFAFEGRSVAPLPDGAFTEFTQLPEGLAEWSMRYRIVSGGAGPQTVTIPDGAWFNEILPAGTYEGAGFSGISDFGDGSLRLPESR